MSEHGGRTPSPAARVVLSYMGSRGVTIGDLVEYTGISRSTLSKFLNGRWQNINVDTLMSLAKALNIPIDLLVGTNSEPNLPGRDGRATLSSVTLCVLQPGSGGPELVPCSNCCSLVFSPEAMGMPSLPPDRKLMAMPVVGDSLAPAVCGGDTIVLDATPDALVSIADNGIYLFACGQMAYLRRLSVTVKGDITIRGDNHGPDEHMTAEEARKAGFRIIGRAVALFRRI